VVRAIIALSLNLGFAMIMVGPRVYAKWLKTKYSALFRFQGDVPRAAELLQAVAGV